MRRFATIPGFILSLIFILAGCGGGSSPKSTVTQVVLSASSLSMNAGDVAQILATPEDASKNPVTASVSFSSSNTSVVTISNSNGAATALICAGVWDSSFIVCNGTNSSGSAISGTANVTATASGVTSSPLTVTVHPKVTSVVVDAAPAGCTSSTHTQQFAAHACSSFVIPHASSGPCAPNAAEITSGIGSFVWSTTDPGVSTVDTNGLVTAGTPGQNGIIASASGATSSATPFRTCMPVRIRLHVNGDPAGSPTTSANMTQNQTLVLEADMDDENGVTTNSVATVIASNLPPVGSISGLALSATSFGGAGIIAGCTPPTCGNGFPSPFPIYSNLFRVTVAGTSPATTVYVTSSFAPPSGTSPTLVPIDTGTGTAGTAITLPGVPNSLVFANSGLRAYLGTTAGLVALDPNANAVAVIDPSITGKVLAVSPNGSKVIVSNAAKDPQGNVIQPNPPNQRVWAFDQTNNSTQAFVKPGAVAASIDTDGFRDYILTNDGSGNIYVFSPILSLQTINVPGSGVDVAPLASDGFVYVATSGAGLIPVGTCNNAPQAVVPTNSGAIQLVQPVANADIIVAVDSPGVDVETATITPLTPPITISPANCTPGISYSNQFLDFGIGAFTARQLLVASNGSIVAVLPSGLNKVLVAVPGASPSVASITLPAGATEPTSGGMTPDGKTVWVGVAGTNTVDKIDLTTNTDTKQVATSFKKSDSSAAPPDIVAVRPK